MEVNRCQLVRESCTWVSQQATHVKINREKLEQLADRYEPAKDFDADSFHATSQDPELALLQLFMMDLMNFCFWPLPNFQYEHLGTNIQLAVKEGVTLSTLANITEEQLITKIFHGVKIPQAAERARILREFSLRVTLRFEGCLSKILSESKQSAVQLLNILTQNFSNFQDHMIYKGHQVHFYKRAQILIGDIYAKFNRQGLGSFKDIHELTIFPDYRLPQVFQAEEVFEYSESLGSKIKGKEEITDRYEEAEIRASSVVAVEMMKDYLSKQGKQVISIELDWFLWQRGEQNLSGLPPHHRCLTIYY